MTPLDQNCPLCRGRGWYEAPGYDTNFGPGMEMHACELCTPVEPMPRWVKVTLGLLVALTLALLIGSFR